MRSCPPSRLALRAVQLLGGAVALWVILAASRARRASPVPRATAGSADSATSAARVQPAAPAPRSGPELVALDELGPSDPIVDDDFVYWISRNENYLGTRLSRVMRARKAGGEVTALAAGMNILALAADHDHLYWTERGELTRAGDRIVPTGAVRRVAKRGGAPVTLAAHRDGAGAIAVTAGRVYWIENREFDALDGPRLGAVMSIEATGGRPRQLDAGRELREAYHLALDPSRLLVSEDHHMTHSEAMALIHPASDTGGSGGIRAYDLATGARADLYLSFGYSYRHCQIGNPCGPVTAIAANANRIAWISYGFGGTILVNPASGGESTTLAVGPALPSAIAIDDGYVYWAAIVDESYRGRGQLLRIPITGGTATVLADGLDHPHSIAVDRDHVYWAEWLGGRIARIAKH